MGDRKRNRVDSGQRQGYPTEVFVPEVDGFSVSAADMKAAGWVKAERLQEASATIALLEAEMGARPSGSANDAVRLGTALADRDAAVRRRIVAETQLCTAHEALLLLAHNSNRCPECHTPWVATRGEHAHSCTIGVALGGAEASDG